MENQSKRLERLHSTMLPCDRWRDGVVGKHKDKAIENCSTRPSRNPKAPAVDEFAVVAVPAGQYDPARLLVISGGTRHAGRRSSNVRFAAVRAVAAKGAGNLGGTPARRRGAHPFDSSARSEEHTSE